MKTYDLNSETTDSISELLFFMTNNKSVDKIQYNNNHHHHIHTLRLYYISDFSLQYNQAFNCSQS